MSRKTFRFEGNKTHTVSVVQSESRKLKNRALVLLKIFFSVKKNVTCKNLEKLVTGVTKYPTFA